MSATPREIGTLIVVVLKANHLPNKRHIGKQDPYCVVEVNGEKRRTKAIKRGGQHPEWDEEIRFTLHEDVNDILDRTENGDKTPPPPPPKDSKDTKIKGGKTMKLACYADDPREPDLIGEANVDLTEVLTKGETDEWFNLSHKDKFAGKVYLELTFWSNAPPPEKKTAPKTAKNKQYAGPGSFVPSGDPAVNGTSRPSRVVSTSVLHSHRAPDSVMASSLRPSSSLAEVDLYAPPYEQKGPSSAIDQVTNDFGEFGFADSHRRRESFPSLGGGVHTPGLLSSSGFSACGPNTSDGHGQIISDRPSAYFYDQLVGHSSVQRSYQAPYENAPSSYQSTIRGPRHSIPTTSSGFVPLPPASDSTSYGTTTLGYAAHHPQPTYISQTPLSTSMDGYISSVPSSSFIPPQSFPQSQSFHYPATLSTTPSPQPYSPTTPVAQTYTSYTPAPSPSRNPLPPSSSLPTNLGGSRPLPQQPQVVYSQVPLQYTSGSVQQPMSSFGGAPPGNITLQSTTAYQPTPPPPPPIQYQLERSSQQVFHPAVQGVTGLPPLPPPPPPPVFPAQLPSGLPPVPNEQHLQHSVSGMTMPLVQSTPPRSRRQSSLPQPPVTYGSSAPGVYQAPLPLPPPPPPLPELNLIPPPPPPSIEKIAYLPGSQILPNPPTLINSHSQYSPVQSNSSGYT